MNDVKRIYRKGTTKAQMVRLRTRKERGKENDQVTIFTLRSIREGDPKEYDVTGSELRRSWKQIEPKPRKRKHPGVQGTRALRRHPPK